MTTFNLTCEAVEATLPDYLDETLEAWVRESIDEHIGGCARCTALARDLRNLEREAAALPALAPERDIWIEVADGIGAPVRTQESVPVITPDPVPESEPLIATSEPPVLADAPPQVVAPSAPAPIVISEQVARAPIQVSQPVVSAPLEAVEQVVSAPLQIREAVATPPLQVSERVISVPLEIEPISSAPALIGEVVPESDWSPHARKPLFPPTESTVPTSEPVIALAERRKKRWGPAWVSVAAAALVLVTAGTTFLLTARRFGDARSPDTVTDAVTRQASSNVKLPAGRGTRAPSSGRQQVDPSASALQRPALTAATTSIPAVTRSPDEAVYDKEINMLQRMTRRRTTELDASTAAVIEKNLEIIDSNIAQIRAALQKDPGSPLLGDQVSRALDMKVELLRRVALLRSNT